MVYIHWVFGALPCDSRNFVPDFDRVLLCVLNVLAQLLELFPASVRNLSFVHEKEEKFEGMGD